MCIDEAGVTSALPRSSTTSPKLFASTIEHVSRCRGHIFNIAIVDTDNARVNTKVGQEYPFTKDVPLEHHVETRSCRFAAYCRTKKLVAKADGKSVVDGYPSRGRSKCDWGYPVFIGLPRFVSRQVRRR